MTAGTEPRKLRYAAPEFLSICSDRVRVMYEFWLALRGDRPLPYRRDLDPSQIKPHLPFLMLVDVVGDPPDFVYRLVGTREVDSRGYDPTGRRVAEAYFATSAEDALSNYRQVAREKIVLYDCEPVQMPGNYYYNDETLFMPFAIDGEAVAQIMVYSVIEHMWHDMAKRPRKT